MVAASSYVDESQITVDPKYKCTFCRINMAILGELVRLPIQLTDDIHYFTIHHRWDYRIARKFCEA